MIESLADLLHPHDPGQLLDAVVKHQRLKLQTDRAQQFGALLPWSRLNALIAPDSIASGRIEFGRNSSFLPAEMLVRRKRGDKGERLLHTASLQSNCRRGLSAVVKSIQQNVRDIALMNAIVERELRATVHTNAYVSFGRDSIFNPHWDDQNVLVLQIHGRKQWRCWGQRWAYPVDKAACPVPADLGPAEWEGTLLPGDILYLPRGDIHAAQVVDGEDSVHLSVTIMPPRGDALVKALATACQNETIARRDLPALASPEERDAWMAEMKAVLRQAVDALDLDELLANLDQAREPLAFTSLGLMTRLTPATRFQPALLRRLPISPSADGTTTVHAGSQSWRLNALEATFLKHALERQVLAVQDLSPLIPTADDDAIRQAVVDLATKGLLVLLDD